MVNMTSEHEKMLRDYLKELKPPIYKGSVETFLEDLEACLKLGSIPFDEYLHGFGPRVNDSAEDYGKVAKAWEWDRMVSIALEVSIRDKNMDPLRQLFGFPVEHHIETTKTKEAIAREKIDKAPVRWMYG